MFLCLFVVYNRVIFFDENGAVSHFPPCITGSGKANLLRPALITEEGSKVVLKQRWLNNKALAINYYLTKTANIFSQHSLQPVTCQAIQLSTFKFAKAKSMMNIPRNKFI